MSAYQSHACTAQGVTGAACRHSGRSGSLHAASRICTRSTSLYRAQIKGAKRIIAIDRIDERLQLASDQFNVDIIDRRSEKDVAAKILELCPGGVDAAIEAVGFRFPTTITHKVERAVGMETDAPDILVECFTAVRKYGRVSIIGDYVGLANHFPVGTVRAACSCRPCFLRWCTFCAQVEHVCTHRSHATRAPAIPTLACSSCSHT